MSAPGPYAAENLKSGEAGRFFDDYCNWTRIPEFETVLRDSPAAAVAADLMATQRVQMFHDHILVKEPGTSKATPWHQDGPYYFVGGQQNVSFWSPLDPVTEASLRCVAGSHKWAKPVLPTRWLAEESFYPNEDDYMPVPDPRPKAWRFANGRWSPAMRWRLTLAFCTGRVEMTVTSAAGPSLCGLWAMTRAMSERPGPTSPPFPGHEMQPGQKLRADWFPVIFDRGTSAG